MKISRFRSKSDLNLRVEDFPNKSKILLITGLSGSGKSYLANQLKEKYNAISFQPEWLKHSKHITNECKYILDSFLELYPNITNYVANKWNNAPSEDENELFKEYINKFFIHFLKVKKEDQLYIVEGLQLFTLIDYELIKNYPIIIKRTSSFKSLKNRIKRDYQKRKNEKLKVKVKWFFRVLKESRLYQFKHRKKLNNFIKKGTTM